MQHRVVAAMVLVFCSAVLSLTFATDSGQFSIGMGELLYSLFVAQTFLIAGVLEACACVLLYSHLYGLSQAVTPPEGDRKPTSTS